jgi:mannose-1-phosphate guanylyltransferase
MDVYAVIMAGGAGTRLWPLSTKEKPKQVHKLVGENTLFQDAVHRVKSLVGLDNIFIVAGAGHVPELKLQEPDIPNENFIVEPSGMGTAPCIGLAAIHLESLDPKSVMIVLTADHHIGDVGSFREALLTAIEVAEKGYLVTLGIKPNEPSTGYGYIEHGHILDTEWEHDVLNVKRFTEKPDFENAARMVKSGKYSWNSGMFIWRVDRILEEFRDQMPGLSEQLGKISKAIGSHNYKKVLEESWKYVPKETIDYGIMENASNVAVIPVDIGWSDLGSWSSLMEILTADENGNVIRGNHIGVDTQNSLVYGGKRIIATISIKDLVIVDTGEALLVCNLNHDQKVREIVNKLRESKN